MRLKEQLGATYLGDSACRFLVWAPLAQKVEVHIIAPEERILPLERDARGYHHGVLRGVEPRSLYFYRLDGNKEYPDPASHLQPEGVHGPSQIVDSSFAWEDSGWSGLPFQQYIIYELHVGAFTSEGTFEAVIPFLDKLKELGITALELMPVAQFPGNRNWGYDGVHPFAVQNSYGGLGGLKRLVNACHLRGLSVVLDVVYNHLGPEGNYLGEFGHYFTERYQTAWGRAINFDGAHCDAVRRFFIENARYWFTEFHIDALRLDALHAILDFSPQPFLAELAAAVCQLREELNRRIYLIGESDANDRRLLLPKELGGYGLDAQWNEGFHHALHALLTDEQTGYYEDFGQLQHLVKAFREGFVYSGQYSPYRKRRHGSSSRDIPARCFVVFAQNHDQVGNRLLGERLSQLVSFESLKLAAGAVLLSPFIPLLFMGDEYGESAPFQYFTSHSDAALIEAVRKGRRDEFAAFHWQGESPDPQDEATFLRSKLDHSLRNAGEHKVLWMLYQELLRIRRETSALARLDKDTLEVISFEKSGVLYIRRWSDSDQAALVFNFGDAQATLVLPIPAGRWWKLLDSEDEKWFGRGTALPSEFVSEGEVALTLKPLSFAVFNSEEA